MRKVLIATICHGDPKARYVESLAGLLLTHLEGTTLAYTMPRGTERDIARQKAAQEAVEGGFSHIFFMDADMTCKPEALNLLLQDDLDVVSGLYFNSEPPFAPVVREYANNGLLVWHTPEPGKVQEVGAVGGGALLIRVPVLRTMGRPWFQKHDGITEDVSFCMKARGIGIRIYLDSRVKFGHLPKDPEPITGGLK